MDTQSGAIADLGGYHAIVPGDSKSSELIQRITTDDADIRMPPADSKPPLSAEEVETLSRWIDQGGAYQQHWAFVPPTKPGVPNVEDPTWCEGEIDRFLLSRMSVAGLTPSKPASQATLVRRLYLDLTGTTPSPEQVSRFLKDDHPLAYRRLVDHLLASPDYAERFARPWLDLARYSDTNGYEKDRPRTIWPYRDWVIQAINADKPFDQFSIEQIAGDMLPGSTDQQKIATGFHRNTMLNEEGGIDPLEYRFYAMVDRVATTGTVWMGLTTGCAQCHTHKYDPITHTDYYALLGLMNNADEPELTADSDSIRQHRARLLRQIRQRENQLADRLLISDGPANADVKKAFASWQEQQLTNANNWKTLLPVKMATTMPRLSITDSGSILASGDVTKRDVYTVTMPPIPADAPIAALQLEVLPHASLPASGPGMAFYEGRRGDFFLSELDVIAGGQNVELSGASHSYGKISIGSGGAAATNVLDGNGSTGWSTSGREGEASRLVVNFAEPFSSDEPWTVKLLFERHFAAALGHFRISVTDELQAQASPHDRELEAALYRQRSGSDELTGAQLAQLRRTFIQTSETCKQHRAAIEQLRKQLPASTRTLVMRERNPEDYRTTNRHHRGEYLQPKEPVVANVPAVFRQADDKAVTDRLQLARWLVSDKNPLVARVVVNRAWREFFGTGIVRTAGDFGTQSEPPSHPKLIDWLSRDFVENGWSLKRLHRQIVLSKAYQQEIGPAPETDPGNRLLSCFPHRRLDAERIRDALLSASGLMCRKIGGPSVYPPQPASVFTMAYGKPSWKTSTGGDRYRRSLYTFAKRTAPFAAYMTFDGSSGEQCIARRDSSTTPLQALTLLNDAMFIEFADALAKASTRQAGQDARPDQIADLMFRRLFVRAPDQEELTSILQFYDQQSDREQPWALVARVLLNLDEAITIP